MFSSIGLLLGLGNWRHGIDRAGASRRHLTCQNMISVHEEDREPELFLSSIGLLVSQPKRRV